MEKVEKTFPITAESDVISVLGSIMNFGIRKDINSVDLCRYVTAVSELGTNLVKYAHDGELTISLTFYVDSCEAIIISKDKGPGIENINRALKENFSTGDTLGLGLASCKRIADQFKIKSDTKGTVINFKKVLQYE